jgi:hypothetical protein
VVTALFAEGDLSNLSTVIESAGRGNSIEPDGAVRWFFETIWVRNYRVLFRRIHTLGEGAVARFFTCIFAARFVCSG